MKSVAKKLLCMLLTAALIIGLVPMSDVPGARVKAATVIETKDPGQIKELLEGEGDVSIKLTGDVEWDYDKYINSDWTLFEIGDGTKTLDLNGHRFKYWILASNYANKVYMFGVGTGAKLVIKDSSGTNKGKLDCDATFCDPGHGINSSDAFNDWVTDIGVGGGCYENSDVEYRHYFYVNGGDVAFDGGEISTHSKKEWVYWGINIKDYYSGISRNTLMYKKRRDRYVWQNINSVAFTVLSGNVTINGGKIYSRGYRNLETTFGSGYGCTSSFKRAACIVQSGGNVIINNGVFNANGGAEYVQKTGGTMTIRAGIFLNQVCDYNLIPSIEDGYSFYMSGSYGKSGIPVDTLDPNNVGVIALNRPGFDPYGNMNLDLLTEIKSSEWSAETITDMDGCLFIMPRENAPTKLFSGTTGAELTKISWDLSGDPWYYIPVSQYWTGYMDGKSFFKGYLSLSDKLGVAPAVTINGNKISGGGSLQNEIASFEISNSKGDYFTDNSGNTVTPDKYTRMKFYLKDIIPSTAKMGDVYQLSIESCESIANNAGNICATRRSRKIVEVRIENMNPVVKTQPVSKIVDKAGTLATLTAKAEDATGAYWLKVMPADGTKYEGTFDKSTGTATLKDYEVTENCALKCVFTNENGDSYSDTAELTIRPGSSTETIDIYCSSKQKNYVKILPDDLKGISDEVKTAQWWYKSYGEYGSGRNAKWGRIDNNTESINVTDYCKGSMMWIKHPTVSAAGYYKMEATLEINGEEIEYKSPVYHLHVDDGNAPKEITGFTMLGMEDLYWKDEAPTADGIDIDNQVTEVKSLSWTSGVKSGVLTEHQPTFKAVVSVTDSAYAEGYRFNKNNTTNSFTVGINGETAEYYYNSTLLDGFKSGVNYSHAMVISPDGKTVEFYYDFSGNALPAAYDKLEVTDPYIIANKGDYIDIDLNKLVRLTCHYRHLQEGTEHKIDHFELNDAANILNVWGLSVDRSTGHLKGTLKIDLTDAGYLYLNAIVSPASTDPVYSFNLIFVPEGKRAEGELIPDGYDTSELMHVHEWGEWTDSGFGNHKHTCATCGSVESQVHFYDEGVETVPATAVSEGVMTYTCEACGSTFTEPIPVHRLVKVGAKPATETTDGFVDCWLCVDCGCFFEDEEGTKEITVDAIIPATGKKDIASCTISGLGNKAWTGAAVKPEVTVKNKDGVKLVKGTDYTVSYSNNKNVGTATVMVTGIGDYAGSVKKNFTIKKVTLKYRAYVQKKGWMSWQTATIGTNISETNMAGTKDNLRMETIQMQMSGIDGEVSYRAYVQKDGWTQWATTKDINTYAGTKGQSKRVEMIQLQAKGQVSNLYDIYYRTYCEKFGWLGWAGNNEKSGSAGYARKLEAFQVQFVAKGARFNKGTAKAFYDKAKDGANP